MLEARPGHAREGEQVVDQGPHLLHVAQDDPEDALAFRVERGGILVEEDLAEGVDRAQRRPQVVGDRVAERLELRVGGGERGGTSAHTLLQLGVEGTDLLLGRLAHADVADGRGDEDALGALERAEHDLDRELGAVLAQGDELDPGADLLGQGVGRRAQVVGDEPLGEALRDDVRDRLADELVAAVAELLLGLDVEQDDLAALVHHDHRVRRRLEQAPVAGLGALAFGDVAGDRKERRAAAEADNRAAHLDLDERPVLPLVDGLDEPRTLPGDRLRAGRRTPDLLRRANVGRLHGQHLVTRVAKTLTCRAIGFQAAQVAIPHEDGVVGRLDERSEAFLRLAQATSAALCSVLSSTNDATSPSGSESIVFASITGTRIPSGRRYSFS